MSLKLRSRRMGNSGQVSNVDWRVTEVGGQPTGPSCLGPRVRRVRDDFWLITSDV